MVDLHVHSIYSDGTFTPEQVVRQAVVMGLIVIGLTDHDSVSGVAAAQAEGRILGVDVVPGCEFSAEVDGRDVHILGYYIDCDSPALLNCLETYQNARRERAEQMVRKLNGLGVKLRIEHVLAKAGAGAIGRPHVADAMVEEGFVFSADQAFHKYLGYARPAYEPKYALTPREAVDVIHGAGGLACLAHPVLYRRDELIPGLVEDGLDGIEVRHIKHGAADVARYSELADRYGLIPTGGSDCHGDGRGQAVMGTVEVPFEYVEALREAHRARPRGPDRPSTREVVESAEPPSAEAQD